MAEYINKEELIKACDYTVCYEDDEETFGISEARIDLMPTIDIVHCSECKWRLKANVGKGRCVMHNSDVGEDYFCADGEREEKR